MTKFVRKFLGSEDGAVTVDWVVLTAGLLIFGVMVAALITSGSTDMANSTGNSLGGATVPQVVF